MLEYIFFVLFINKTLKKIELDVELPFVLFQY